MVLPTKPLLIVAHPDDETGGTSTLLQRTPDAIVVYCTDGAPDDSWFWGQCNSRAAYANTRRDEARRALTIAGVRNPIFLADFSHESFHDQRLHQALPLTALVLFQLVRLHGPDAIVTPAYEGGHPDHDCCSFLSWVVGSMSGLPVWEFPLYHRDSLGQLVTNVFAECVGTEITLNPTNAELGKRQEMLAQYASQRDLAAFVTRDVEWLRPQSAYDYAKRPCVLVNYEQWGWPVAAGDICREFYATVEGLKRLGQSSHKEFCGPEPSPGKRGGMDSTSVLTVAYP
jgi:N-acetylglucosamine malate deacetylase 2